MQYLVGADFPK